MTVTANTKTKNGKLLLKSAGCFAPTQNYTSMQYTKLADTSGSFAGKVVKIGNVIFGEYYDGSNYHLGKFDVTTGQLTILAEMIRIGTKPILASDGYLYFIDNTNKRLCRTDMNSGYEILVTIAGFITSTGIYNPQMLEFNGNIYFVCGPVYQYNMLTRVLTSTGTPTPTTYDICEYNGQIYAGGSTTYLYRWDGGTTWTNVGTGGSSRSTQRLFVWNNKLYVVMYYSSKGELYRYDESVGLSSVITTIPTNSYSVTNLIILNDNTLVLMTYTGDYYEVRKIGDSYLVSDAIKSIVSTINRDLADGDDVIYFASGSSVYKEVKNTEFFYRDTSGNTRIGSMQTAPSDTLGQEYFRVGSNNTPKAFEDHQLQEINGITYGATARVETYDAVNNVMVTTISCNVTNTTAADITVYEMGLYVYLLNPNGAFLTDRYVPAVPIVIPAGQTVPLYFNIGEVWN